ncbi:hypothetical protein ISF6_5056 [Piscinibacter sakaiensis]|uniref:Uncharacterized protein n=2 Tax=Piscinibacter sakaiensis TaxID=1547922 RepID=A0A0K8NW11_PISS1|nr:hypothetical protein ISF6_5056 [Piscinibacter sakaiensis]
MALGLGRVNTLSSLGSVLEFSVAVSSEPGDALAPDCISADVYAGDTRVPPEMVRVRLSRATDGRVSALRVSTGTRIDEPVASVQLTLDCGTRISRNYVVFIDPPQLELAQSAGGLAPRSEAPAVREPGARPPSTRRGTRTARSSDPGRVQAGGTGEAGASRPRRAARNEAARAAARAAARESGSRLQLESAPAIAAGGPVSERRSGGAGRTAAAAPAASAGGLPLRTAPPAAAAASSPVATPGSAASAAAAVAAASGASAAGLGGLLGELAAKADADAIAQQAEQLKSLEQRLTRLSAQNQSLQKTMGDLQARLADAEASRYANPLVYAMAALVLLLLAVVAALLWRQRGLQKESDWLKAAAAESDAPRAATPEVRSVVRPSAPPPVARTAAAAAAAAGLGGTETVSGVRARAADEAAGAAAGGASVELAMAAGLAAAAGAAAVAAPAAIPHESTSVQADPRREVSVEELIDLEQQADFFVVLGQDDAAIDLLMGHVQGTGGASPLPYLKLLEIHRRRGERDLYDRVRERFNRRFTANAPEWDAAIGNERALEDYPSIVERLQGLWARPVEAMAALSGWLFQRDPSAPTFDLPAYGDLLFLYSLARELADSEPPPDGVDLLLPLDDGPGPTAPGGAGGRGAALGGAALAAGAAGMAAAAADDGLSLAPTDALPTLPETPPTYPVPLAFPESDRPAGDDDFGLLDLNISDEPEEPKGPLSRY